MSGWAHALSIPATAQTRLVERTYNNCWAFRTSLSLLKFLSNARTWVPQSQVHDQVPLLPPLQPPDEDQAVQSKMIRIILHRCMMRHLLRLAFVWIQAKNRSMN